MASVRQDTAARNEDNLCQPQSSPTNNPSTAQDLLNLAQYSIPDPFSTDFLSGNVLPCEPLTDHQGHPLEFNSLDISSNQFKPLDFDTLDLNPLDFNSLDFNQIDSSPFDLLLEPSATTDFTDPLSTDDLVSQ